MMILLKFLEKNIINYSALLEELNLLYTTQVRWDIRPPPLEEQLKPYGGLCTLRSI